ncbi:MAG: hypothetical protein AB1324_06555 [Candidatus Micrarchaeota archaeon]
MSAAKNPAALAAKKEETSSGVRRLTQMLKEPMAEPQRGFHEYVGRAKSRLDMVRPKVDEARAFVDMCTARPDLDDYTLTAETASAKVVVSLFETLERLHAKAKEGADAYPLKCISVAANTLAAYLRKEHLLKHGTYPETDAVLLGRIVESRIGTANEIHLQVTRALDGQHEALGVALPPPPCRSSLAQ